MNVYDAVLAEASDLWQAASDAQQLGRLKMASSYLLLLHARLVGLGKRFDKAQRPTVAAATSDPANALGMASPAKKLKASPADSSSTTAILTPRTARTLSDMLPDDIQLDQGMMEHLAQAAAELHAHRRGGGGKGGRLHGGRANTTTTSPAPKNDAISVLWSENEIRIMTQALDEARRAEPVAPASTPFDPPLSLTMALAQQLGRNPNHVRAFLRNQIAKSRIATHLALDGTDATGGSSASTSETTPGRGPQNLSLPTAVHTVPHAECNAKLLLQGYFLEGGPDHENGTDEDDDNKNDDNSITGTDGETAAVKGQEDAKEASANPSTRKDEPAVSA
jgi:hypothetical protein